jgi:hypothetical protein
VHILDIALYHPLLMSLLYHLIFFPSLVLPAIAVNLLFRFTSGFPTFRFSNLDLSP